MLLDSRGGQDFTHPFERKDANMRWILIVASVLFSFGAAAEDINDLFGQLIRGRGFDCPIVKSVTLMGNDAYGKIAKMWCGSADNRGNPVYFRVTEIGNPRSYRIEPWHD